MQGRQEELLTAVPTLVGEVLRQHGELRLRAHGGSMFPVVRSGDVLSIRHATAESIEPGDIVLLLDGDRLFAHRLVQKRPPRGAPYLITRGDAHRHNDPPRPASTLLGQVVAVTRNGRLRQAPFRARLVDRARGVAASEWRKLVWHIRVGLHRFTVIDEADGGAPAAIDRPSARIWRATTGSGYLV
jgi:hypothetical protein